MKSCLLSAVLLLSACIVFAQDKRQIVQGNSDINASIPDSVKYKYSSFTSGAVTFKDGTQGGSLLNYNLLAGEVQFVSSNGDTLSLANEHTIKNISINQDTFYFDKMYLQLIEGNAIAKLAKNEKMNLVDEKKMGAFGMYTSSGGIENYSSLNTGTRTLRLEENKQMVFVIHTAYYIGDRYYHFMPATKKNVLKMFNKQGLENYLSNNNIDFHNEEDLRKILDFLKDKNQ